MNVCLTGRGYTLPLRRPVPLPGGAVGQRSGILVRAERPDGAAGWGDAAPLPGFSPESLNQVRAELDALQAGSRELDGCCSSVRFAVESAAASADAHARGVTLGEHLLGRAAAQCAVNALLAGAPEDWPQEAVRCAAEGFGVAKVKVGRAEWAREAAALRAAVKTAPTLRWRLDANRAWPAETALAFARAVEGLPIEYIEEPLCAGEAMPSDWPRGLGIALDETLHGFGPIPAFANGIAALVIKPTLCGGLARSLRLAEAAWRAGRAVVFSSAYESGVGVRVLAELGAACGTAAGLDTYRALAEDVLDPPLQITGGALDVAASRRSEVKR